MTLTFSPRLCRPTVGNNSSPSGIFLKATPFKKEEKDLRIEREREEREREREREREKQSENEGNGNER